MQRNWDTNKSVLENTKSLAVRLDSWNRESFGNLFVICIERLSHLINESVQKGEWKGINLSMYSPVLTHIFFSNDMVLFSEATEN